MRQSTSASAQLGSNCRERSFLSTAMAWVLDIALRYGLSEVMASYASATAMIRAPISMSLPLTPSGYPLPSKRSWWWRKSPLIGLKKDMWSTMFLLVTGWRCMIRYSRWVRFPRFMSTASGISILPMSCSCAP
ncbi:MAG: hypothetical protein AMS17_14090 [Spirochaetes bacterium DG_61]|nr:MAG: hypothetical protein AMS17_14090 [Spirochaetes bacterium DG_61]